MEQKLIKFFKIITGYGNLAPTTHLSRILMIFYGLFGIPINGILLANLGEYFGMQVRKLVKTIIKLSVLFQLENFELILKLCIHDLILIK